MLAACSPAAYAAAPFSVSFSAGPFTAEPFAAAPSAATAPSTTASSLYTIEGYRILCLIAASGALLSFVFFYLAKRALTAEQAAEERSAERRDSDESRVGGPTTAVDVDETANDEMVL